jgi:hypothetical protein
MEHDHSLTKLIREGISSKVSSESSETNEEGNHVGNTKKGHRQKS